MAVPQATTQAPNVAPEAGLAQALSQKQNDHTVEVEAEAWLKEIRQQVRSENGMIWRNQNLLWEMLMLFLAGNHLLRRGSNGRWRAYGLPERTDEPVWGYNIAGFYSRTIRSRWTQSNTDIRWRAETDEDWLGGAASAAQKIHDSLKRKLYTETFKQIEALNAQCGKYARYIYYTNDVKAYGRQERYEEQEIGFGGGNWFCPDCGNGGGLLGDGADLDGVGLDGQGLLGGNSADASASVPGRLRDGLSGGYEGVAPPEAGDLQAFGVQPQMACPVCGSPNAVVEQVPPLTTQSLAGYDQVEVGDFVCESVFASELKHDLGCLPQDSPYLLRTRRLRRDALQSSFPFLKLPDALSDDPGAQAADELKRQVYASSGVSRGRSSSSEAEKTADFFQLWLDPSLYRQKMLKTPYRTLDGAEVPAGTRLIDLFPGGMYLCWVEGVEGVVEWRDEHHRDYWIGQVYQPKAMSALGSGIEDIIDANRQYDLMMSLIYMQLRTGGAPATLFDHRLLPNGISQYIGSLQNLPVNTAALLEEGKTIRDAVHQLMPQPPSGQHFEYLNQMNRVMQYSSNVVDFGDVLPGQKSDTATAAQLTSSLGQSLFGPQLALRAEVDQRTAEILLKLWKKHCHAQRYVTLSGKHGRQDGEWLSAADVESDLHAEIVPESYLPQTSFERRQRFQAFLADIGGFQGLEQAMATRPEFVEKLADLHDVELGSEDYTVAAELCRRRLEQMKVALPSLAIWLQGLPPTQVVADPVTGEGIEAPVDPLQEAAQFLLSTLQPPIIPEELGHLAAIAWCRSWLSEDEGLDAPPVLRAGVIGMMHAHIQGVMAEAQLMGMVAMAGMPMEPGLGQQIEAPAHPDSQKDKNPAGKRPSPKPQKQAAQAA